MTGQPRSSQGTRRSCPYCAAMGCFECGHTGLHWDATGTTENGATFRAHGSGDLSPEDMEALKPLVDAALAQMSTIDDRAPLPDRDECPTCGRERVRTDGPGWGEEAMFCVCQIGVRP